MDKATVTSKGQITLPQHIRKILNIETGDKLLFSIEDDELRVRVMHERKISELFASLPGVEAYAGEDAERQAARAGFVDDPK